MKKSKRSSSKKTGNQLRPQSKRIALEPRIVFDAALPIAMDMAEPAPDTSAPVVTGSIDGGLQPELLICPGIDPSVVPTITIPTVIAIDDVKEPKPTVCPPGFIFEPTVIAIDDVKEPKPTVCPGIDISELTFITTIEGGEGIEGGEEPKPLICPGIDVSEFTVTALVDDGLLEPELLICPGIDPSNKPVLSISTEAPKDTEAPKALETETTQPAERDLIEGTLAPTGLNSDEIIFIDATVEDLEQYITDHPNADVVLIDSSKDGVEQIAAILSGRTDINAIHILSHGEAGQINLGSSILNTLSLTGEYADEFATIKASLADDADILIYGCNAAAGAKGQAFVSTLALATGADIAASDDITGAQTHNGDWDLETNTGTIQAQNIEATAFAGILADTDGDGVDDAIDIDDDNDGILDINEGASTPTNLIANGDFTNFTGWTESHNTNSTTGGFTISTSFANSPLTSGPFGASNGNGAARSYVDNDGDLGGVVPVNFRSDVTLNIVNGEVYDFAFDVAEHTSSTNSAAQLSWVLIDATTGAIAQIIPNTTMETDEPNSIGGLPLITTAWQNITSQFTAAVTSGTYNLAMTWDVYQDPIPTTQLVTDIYLDRVFFASANASTQNTDSDNVADHVDLDSDNDGISDLYESGASAALIAADTNNDGTVSAQEADLANDGLDNDNQDADGDGLMDIFDANTSSTDPTASVGTIPTHSDTDGIADYIDLDSDNDGIADTVEARPTAGYVNHDGTQVDNDGDGVLDIFDANDATAGGFGGTHANFNAPVNTDGTDNEDYRDTNSDNDALLDSAESGTITTPPSYADPDGSISNPQTDLANEVGDTSEVAYRETNNPPVNTVPGAQTVNEDTSLPFTGANTISVNDVDGNLATTQLTVTNGVLAVSLAGGATISAGASGSSTLTLSGTQAQINAALATLTYQGDLNFNGGDTLTVLSTDSAGVPLSDTDTVAITVNADTDSDGIADIDDIDDDNDGILDVNEGLLPGPTILFEETFGTIGVDGVNDVNLNLGSANVESLATSTNTIGTASAPYLSGPRSLNTNGSILDNTYGNSGGFVHDDADPTVAGDGFLFHNTSRAGPDGEDTPGGAGYAGIAYTNATEIAVQPNSEYTFSFYYAGSASSGSGVNPTQLQVMVDEQSSSTSGPNFTNFALPNVSAGSSNPVVTPPDHVWRQQTVTFTTGATTNFIYVGINNLQALGNGNDFVLDQIVLTSPSSVGVDTDSDNVADHVDLDSDNDGISDLYESGASAALIAADTNNDGTVSAQEADLANDGLDNDNQDADGDGLMDIFDANTSSTDPTASVGTIPTHSDTDGIADYIDLDSDNDGIADTVEARPTAGYVNHDGTQVDNDGDGVLDIFDANDATAGGFGGTHANFNAPVNTDGTDNEDYRDTNSDNDALLDSAESGTITTPPSYADPDGSISNPQTDLANEVGDTSEVAYRETNNPPVNTVPGAQTVNEDTSLPFTGANTISVNDVDGNLATTQLTVTDGVLAVSLAGGATISAGASGSSTLTLSGTQAQINAALATLTYQGDLNFNGGDTLTVLSTDSAGVPLSDTDTVAITVAPINDAPVNTVPGAQAVDEDTSLPFTGANTISVNDVDGNLATTQLTVTDGDLNVSLAGGATISAGANGSSTLTLSGTQAQINAALATLTYQGDLSFNGGDTLTVLSTDSAGVPLSDTDTVAITVNDVNDPPVATPATTATPTEDGPAVAVPLAGTDVDGTITSLTITSGPTPAQGTLTYDDDGLPGTPNVAVPLNTPLTPAQAATVVFTPAPDYAGPVNPVVFTVTDDDNATSAPANVTIPAIVNINDAPVNTVPGAQAVDEDTSLPFTGANTISVNDVDGNLATTQLTVTDGDLNVSLAGGATISAGANGSSTLTLSGTQAQINAALATLTYQGDLSFNGGDTLTVLSTDSAGVPLSDTDTVAITVNDVNDPPVATPATTATPTEDGPAVAVPLAGTDVDGTITSLTITSGPTPAQGTLTYDDDGLPGTPNVAVPLNTPLTPAQAATVVFTPAPDYAGPVNPVVFTVTDDDNATSAPANVTIPAIVNINDAPVNTVPGAQTVDEDTSLPFTGANTISVNDVDGNLATTQLTVTDGDLNLTLVPVGMTGAATISAGANGSSTLTLSGTQAQINAALATLTYQGDLNFNGGDTLTVLSTDSAGVPLSDTDTVAITVNDVNDPPVATPATTATPTEDGPAVAVPLAGTDVDGTITSLTITSGPTPAQGTLTYDDDGLPGTPNVAVPLNTPLTPAQAATVVFTPAPDYAGPVNPVVFTVTDDDNATSAPANVTIPAIVNINDAPVNTVPGAQTVDEDTSLPFTGANTISVNDVDGNLATTQLTVTDGDLNVSLAGGATISAGANGSSTLTLSGTQAQINAALATLTYQGDLSFNGGDTLTVLSTDSAGVPLSDTDTVAITVNDVNDPPVATPATTATPTEDGPAVAVPLAGTDVDGTITSLTITSGPTPAQGTLTYDDDGLPGTPNVAVPLNTPLTPAQAATVVFTPAPDYAGPVNPVVFTVTDDDNATSAPANVTIPAIVNINDAPVNTVPGAQAVDEDTSLPFTGANTISVNDVDGNLATTQLTVTDGDLNLTLVPVGMTGAATISAGANGSSTLTLSGTQAQINAALATLTYQGDLNFNGGDTLTVLSTDSAGVPLSDTDTVAITVNDVNDPPVATPATTATPTEDGPAVAVPLAGTDVDGTITSLTITSGPTPAQGTLTYDDDGLPGTPNVAVPLNTPLTPAQAATVVFTPAPDYAGPVNPVVFTVTDDDNATSAPANVTIPAIVNINDAPVNTVPGAQTVDEDTSLPFTGANTISVNDVDGNLATTQLTVTDGDLNLTLVPVGMTGAATISAGANGSSTLTLSGTQAQINAALATLTYQGDLNFNGGDTLTVLSTDSAGVPLSDTDTVAITVNDVNDPPVATPATTATPTEDGPAVAVPLAGTDVDGTITSLTITSGPTPAQGTLTYDDDGLPGTPNVAVPLNTPLTPAQAATVVFTPAPDYAGPVNPVVFTVTDDDNATSAPANVTIPAIVNINDAPVATPLTTTGTSEESIPVLLTGTDVDGTVVSVTVTSLPPASEGVLLLPNGMPVTVGIALTPTEAAGLIFKPNLNFLSGNVSITFTVTDNSGAVSPPALASIIVTEASTGLFEQLLTQPPIDFSDHENPFDIEIPSPVIDLGMPEDLHVSNSVRESYNQIAANSVYGVFNANVPTLNEISNFTFDLKGLPRGMDKNLFVQHAIRNLPVTPEQNLFVQNAVHQSQVESNVRNIGITSFINSGTIAISNLLSPFELDSPAQKITELNVKTTSNEQKTDSKISQVKEAKQKELAQIIQEVETLSITEPSTEAANIAKTSTEKNTDAPMMAAPSFANQLQAAANQYKNSTLKQTI